MVITYVSVSVAPENAAAFETNIRQITEAAMQLPGCLTSEWYRHPTQENHYTMYGEFASEEAFIHYRKSPVVEMIGHLLLPILLEKPRFKHFRAEVFEEG